SLKMLQSRLQPETAPDAKRAAGWIQDLGDAEFAVRAQAMKEIRHCARTISHLLRAALVDKPPLEVKRRLHQLLAELDLSEAMTPAWLRQWRALEALERTNSPPAAAIVKILAAGAPDAWLTRHAAAAERRLFDHDPKRAVPDKWHDGGESPPNQGVEVHKSGPFTALIGALR